MIGFPIGMLYANASEWAIHKYVLHGKNHGKKKGTTWSFHFHEHHRNSRRNGMVDPDYERKINVLNGQSKELIGIVGLCAVHTPLLPIAPGFVGAIYFSAYKYYTKHKRSHLDPAWAREHMPWHYDHHMGPNQDANWCVTWPWFDHVMGTREPYAGTEREARDMERARQREKRKKRQAA